MWKGRVEGKVRNGNEEGKVHPIYLLIPLCHELRPRIPSVARKQQQVEDILTRGYFILGRGGALARGFILARGETWIGGIYFKKWCGGDSF